MSVRKRDQAQQQANGAIQHKSDLNDQRTDLTRWRLKDDRGRHTWHYLETEEDLKAWPMSTADEYYLGLDTVKPLNMNLHTLLD